MAYFPAFIKLDNKNILIIGGGTIASKKLEHLLDFSSNIKVIAPQLSDNMKNLIEKNNLLYENRTYQKEDIKDFGIVIIAINDIPLQKEIYEESKIYSNCLCNSVDSVNYCDFIFPSYIKKGDLTITVSTNGSSPALAKQLRIYFENLIPNNISSFLNEMKNHRKMMPKGKERMDFLENKAKDYISKWRKSDEAK